VPLLVKHFAYGGDVLDTVGVITEAKEDSYGLWIHANYLADDDSQAIRAKVQAASDGGLAMGLSVGYRTIRYDISNEDGTTIYNLRELELREGTLTVRPCNELAGVTQSKSDGGEDRSALEDKLAALTGVSKSTISRAIDQAQAGAAGKTADPTGPEIAGLDDLEAAINANRIYLEREKIA
jgi:HK97 family phage prohead protease